MGFSFVSAQQLVRVGWSPSQSLSVKAFLQDLCNCIMLNLDAGLTPDLVATKYPGQAQIGPPPQAVPASDRRDRPAPFRRAAMVFDRLQPDGLRRCAGCHLCQTQDPAHVVRQPAKL